MYSVEGCTGNLWKTPEGADIEIIHRVPCTGLGKFYNWTDVNSFQSQNQTQKGPGVAKPDLQFKIPDCY